MTNVLLITSSPRGDASYSTQVATELVHKIPGAQITERDLWSDPIPHIGPRFVHAAFTPEAARTPEQTDALALSNELITELKSADVVVIGAGMINFGVPSALKSWVDHIARAGQTFSYGEAGPVGLVIGKKLILVLATGGVYSVGPMTALNHLEPYLRSVLGFLGMTDVQTVLAEGIAQGPEAAAKEVAAAKEKAETLAFALAA